MVGRGKGGLSTCTGLGRGGGRSLITASVPLCLVWIITCPITLFRHTMDDELVRVTRLLRPMSLEAGPLMDLVRQARGRGSCTLPPGAGIVGRGASGGGGRQQQQQAVVLEEEAVMRVLARRPERMGSKLLKEEYKMSKRLKA